MAQSHGAAATLFPMAEGGRTTPELGQSRGRDGTLWLSSEIKSISSWKQHQYFNTLHRKQFMEHIVPLPSVVSLNHWPVTSSVLQ